MKTCQLAIRHEYDYGQIENAIESPILQALIFRKGMRDSIKTLAIVDTGFDEGLLISREIRDMIFAESGPPDTHESLSAGPIEIPCEVYNISLRISDKWFIVRAYAPIYDGFETLIGRLVLNRLNLCLRGPAAKVYIAVE